MWTNRPQCMFCSGPARPAVMMFGDLYYQEDLEAGERFVAIDCWLY
jgi:hypothetical protein